jgi:hypothetical protein
MSCCFVKYMGTIYPFGRGLADLRGGIGTVVRNPTLQGNRNYINFTT